MCKKGNQTITKACLEAIRRSNPIETDLDGTLHINWWLGEPNLVDFSAPPEDLPTATAPPTSTPAPILTPTPLPTPAAAPAPPAHSLSGTGTATIDGRLALGEWDNADQLDLVVNVPEGGTTPATLFVMNDEAVAKLSSCPIPLTAMVAYGHGNAHWFRLGDGSCSRCRLRRRLRGTGLDDADLDSYRHSNFHWHHGCRISMGFGPRSLERDKTNKNSIRVSSADL